MLKFFELFKKKGGKFEKKNIEDILFESDKPVFVSDGKKYVFDKYYTSAGVATGIDMSLHIIEKVLGKTVAKNTAKYIEYKY